jgi:pimeloyl-ACP methyl ester carboxylesterase
MKNLEQWCEDLIPDFIMAHGVRTAIFATSERPDVLLIHGINGSHFGLAELARQLQAKGRRPVLVDLPGHGASSTPAWSDIENLRRWFSEVYKSIAAGRALDVVAHSFGCYAMTPIDARLTLICPIPTEKEWLRAMSNLVAWLFRAPPLARIYDLPFLANRRNNILLHNENSRNRRRGAFVIRHEITTTPQQRLYQTKLAKSIPHHKDIFCHISPNLVVVGRFDILARERTVDQIQPIFPKAQIAIVPSGHMPTIECAKRLADLIS